MLIVNVPATANPYLAGMPSGIKAREGDSAPQQSPILVERTLSHAIAVTFAAVGAVQHTRACPPDCSGPNGAAFARHRNGAEHGIADVVAPIDALMGVFIGDEMPDRSKAPRSLDYRWIRRDIDTLSPKLKQVFFIGTMGEPVRALAADISNRQTLPSCISPSWMASNGTITPARLRRA